MKRTHLSTWRMIFKCLIVCCTIIINIFIIVIICCPILKCMTILWTSGNYCGRLGAHPAIAKGYTGTRIVFLHSSGIQPSLTMLLIRSVIHLEPKPPAAFIISLTTPVGPAAFPIFNTLIAAAISSRVHTEDQL